MAADLITYADKVEVNTPSGNADEIWTDVEQNEIKDVVNSHAVDIDAVRDAVDIQLRQSILTVDTLTSGKTLNNNDYAKLFRCDNSTDFTFTYSAFTNIPQGSMLYIQRIGTGEVTVEFDVSIPNIGVSFEADKYRIELQGGVIVIFKYSGNDLLVFGNLKLP